MKIFAYLILVSMVLGSSLWLGNSTARAEGNLTLATGSPVLASTLTPPTLGTGAVALTSPYSLMTSKQHLKLMQFSQNYTLDIALYSLNSLIFPFNIEVNTINDFEYVVKKRSLLIAPKTAEPLTLIVSNKDNPEQSVTLTLLPQNIPSLSYQVQILELLTGQLMINNPHLSAEIYQQQISRLLRKVAEVIVSPQPIPKGKERAYSLNNFKLAKLELNSKDLGLVEITNASSGKNFRPLTCAEFTVTKTREFQPQNLYYAGLRIRVLDIVNPSLSVQTFSHANCQQPHVLAASVLGSETLNPEQTAKVLIIERVDY